MLPFNSLNVLISIVIITSIVTSLYSQPSTIVADNPLFFFSFVSLFLLLSFTISLSLSRFLPFDSINHFYSRIHSSTQKHLLFSYAFPHSLTLTLSLSLFSFSLSLSLYHSIALARQDYSDIAIYVRKICYA